MILLWYEAILIFCVKLTHASFAYRSFENRVADAEHVVVGKIVKVNKKTKGNLKIYNIATFQSKETLMGDLKGEFTFLFKKLDWEINPNIAPVSIGPQQFKANEKCIILLKMQLDWWAVDE